MRLINDLAFFKKTFYYVLSLLVVFNFIKNNWNVGHKYNE